MADDGHDPEAARAASLETAARYGLEILETLPLTEPEELAAMRSPLEVFERCLALDALIEVVHTGNGPEVLEELKRDDQLKVLSKREREYVESRAGGDEVEHERIQMTWKVEVLYALVWILGGVDDLPVTGIVDNGDELAQRVSGKGLALRSPQEIGAKVDLFYCFHWAVREREVSGEPENWPEELDPGAIIERRRGLEWVLRSDVSDPDDVPTDT